jgi:hypothetical protein
VGLTHESGAQRAWALHAKLLVGIPMNRQYRGCFCLAALVGMPIADTATRQGEHLFVPSDDVVWAALRDIPEGHFGRNGTYMPTAFLASETRARLWDNGAVRLDFSAPTRRMWNLRWQPFGSITWREEYAEVTEDSCGDTLDSASEPDLMQVLVDMHMSMTKYAFTTVLDGEPCVPAYFYGGSIQDKAARPVYPTEWMPKAYLSMAVDDDTPNYFSDSLMQRLRHSGEFQDAFRASLRAGLPLRAPARAKLRHVVNGDMTNIYVFDGITADGKPSGITYKVAVPATVHTNLKRDAIVECGSVWGFVCNPELLGGKGHASADRFGANLPMSEQISLARLFLLGESRFIPSGKLTGNGAYLLAPTSLVAGYLNAADHACALGSPKQYLSGPLAGTAPRASGLYWDLAPAKAHASLEDDAEYMVFPPIRQRAWHHHIHELPGQIGLNVAVGDPRCTYAYRGTAPSFVPRRINNPVKAGAAVTPARVKSEVAGSKTSPIKMTVHAGPRKVTVSTSS